MLLRKRDRHRFPKSLKRKAVRKLVAVLNCYARNTQKPILKMIEQDFSEMMVYPAKIDIGRCQGVQVWSTTA